MAYIEAKPTIEYFNSSYLFLIGFLIVVIFVLQVIDLLYHLSLVLLRKIRNGIHKNTEGRKVSSRNLRLNSYEPYYNP